MKVIFVAAGPIEWGSSRMRAWWVAPYMEDATVIQYGQAVPATPDVFIWQKMVNLHEVKANPNARHYWDVCDPMWWWNPEEAGEIAMRVDGIVCSSEALAADFSQWWQGAVYDLASNHIGLSSSRLPVHTIPDRLELSHFTRQRQHQDVSPVRFIWFGVAVNRIALYAALANLERLAANGYKIELTIFDDRPDVPFRITDAFPIYNIPWRLDREVEVLSNHDIALLPPYPGAWGRVKSNNKELTARACGLVTTRGQDYGALVELVSFSGERQTRGAAARYDTLQGWDVRQSAAEWEALLNG